MNRIERYLGQVVFTHTILVLFVLLVILGFFEFMVQIGKLTESYTIAKGALYTLLKLPVYAYEIFPVALLIGALMGLGGLANQSELTILRVTGWSIARILLAVLKTAMLIWLFIALMGEFVAPKSESYAKKLRGEALQSGYSVGSSSGFWLKEPNRYIHVNRIISSSELRGVRIYTQKQGALTHYSFAKKAEYINGEWILFNINKQALTFVKSDIDLPELLSAHNAPKIDWQSQYRKQQSLDFPLKPDVLDSLNIESRYMSVVDLYRHIDFLQENELDSEQYQLAFWRKLAMPLVVIGMIAIVFPLIFGSHRQVSIGQRIFVGILIGMTFSLLNQMFGNLSVVYQLPAIIGAFLPAVLMVIIASYWLKRIR
ncbi:MAG: LPS export ABC transporter permease LptG [Pseudomonadota bacterium]|nr:LPS export ABC transporter permease LptG [Pseudomonadota bacterium]